MKRQCRIYKIVSCGILAGMGLWLGAGLVFSQDVGRSIGTISKSEQPVVQMIAPAFAVPFTAAKVNGMDIPMQVFWNRMISQTGNTVLLSLVDDVLIEQAAEGKIEFSYPDDKKSKKYKMNLVKSAESEVEKTFVEIKKQFPNEAAFNDQFKKSGQTIDGFKKQIRLDVYKTKLLGDKIAVSKEEIKKYFDANKERLGTPEQVHLKHILTASEKEATDILQAVKSGKDFDAQAKEKSLDTATKERGGDLGFIASSMLLPEIQKKIATVKIGEMDIVQTPQGFHVIKLMEIKPAKKATWDDETQKGIEQMLKQEKFTREYPAFIQSLRKQADIQIFVEK